MLKIDELRKLYEEGQYSLLIDQIQSRADNSEFEVTYLHIKALNRSQNLTDAKEVADEFLASRKLDNIQQLKILCEIILSLHRQSKYDTAITYTDEGMDIVNSMEYEQLSSDEKRTISSMINLAGVTNYIKGNYDQANTYYLRLLDIAEEIENDHIAQAAQVNLGLIFQEKGKYQLARTYFKKGLDLAEQNEDMNHIRVAASNLSNLYNLLGNLDKAEQMAKKVIDVTTKSNDNWGKALILHTLGVIHRKRGETSTAKQYLQDAYEMKKQFDNDYEISRSLFFLILIHLEQEERGEARTLLREIRELSKETANERLDLIYRIGEAIYLRYSPLYRHKLKAEQKLRKIIEMNVKMEGDIVLLAFLNLIELLLDQAADLESTAKTFEEEEEEILEDIDELYEAIYSIAKDQNSPELLLQAHYIQAHLHLIGLQSDDAMEQLKLAEKISEASGLKTVTIGSPQIDNDEISAIHESFSYELQNSVNKIIHTLPRLKIIIALMHNHNIVFSELRELVDLSPGNLGNHCDRLIKAGYIEKRKEIVDDRFLTVYSLTPEGISEFQKYSSILGPYLNPTL